jgi:uncharacterized repeat protein (TIGR03803 family)
LYGTTGSGGAADAGTLYKVDRNGKYTVLYSFSGKFDGCEPLGCVAADENGNLYGATSACGDFNQGTVFSHLSQRCLAPPTSMNCCQQLGFYFIDAADTVSSTLCGTIEIAIRIEQKAAVISLKFN